jgi:TrmH RNA methyltransferase
MSVWKGTKPAQAAPSRQEETRVCGFNAVRAVHAARPEAIRKLYLSESRIADLKPLLAWCVRHRVGYRVVEDGDLVRLSGSGHHEGVVADVLRVEPQPLSQWLSALPEGPALAVWLDGVGNPHNFGTILRSAAHFGAAAILLPPASTLTLSAAAARIAEGGAESVPLVRLPPSRQAIEPLRCAGFGLLATVVGGGDDLFAAALPARCVYVLGAEETGLEPGLAAACD